MRWVNQIIRPIFICRDVKIKPSRFLDLKHLVDTLSLEFSPTVHLLASIINVIVKYS